MGFEPMTKAWKALMLPLHQWHNITRQNYTRVTSTLSPHLLRGAGFEPAIRVPHTDK